MFIKKVIAAIFGLGLATLSYADSEIPCVGETHYARLNIANDNGDFVVDLTLYDKAGFGTGPDGAEYFVTQFTSSNIVWENHDDNENNSLYVTALINGATALVISVSGSNGTLTINNKTQDLICDWRRET